MAYVHSQLRFEGQSVSKTALQAAAGGNRRLTNWAMSPRLISPLRSSTDCHHNPRPDHTSRFGGAERVFLGIELAALARSSSPHEAREQGIGRSGCVSRTLTSEARGRSGRACFPQLLRVPILAQPLVALQGQPLAA